MNFYSYTRVITGITMILLAIAAHAYEAIVIVPVADLIGEPAPSEETYTTLPFSAGPKDYTSCKRMHQLLYHERVQVLEEQGNQVRVMVPNIFYINSSQKRPESRFWTLKKYLLPVHTIQQHSSYIPATSSYKQQNDTYEAATITLTHPYYDKTTQTTFSAGTRFVRVDASKSKKKTMVYVLHPQSHQIIVTTLPTRLCYFKQPMEPDERIAHGIKLIRSWIKQAPASAYIPYVWGGTSIVHYTKGKAHLNTSTKPKLSWYSIDKNHDMIKTGCDCSGLIVRAAHIVGIPYFFKNSYTLAHYLKPLVPSTPLAAGDLIWVPGHVMMVADIEHNTLFEARSYDHGYGRLHELPLSSVFKDIETYQDLVDAYYNKKPLYRMDKQGNVQDTFKDYKILQLLSAWDVIY